MRLSVDAINERSPYWVIQLDDMLFRFATRNGIRYHVGFYPDSFFLNEGAYHLFIERMHDDHTPADPLVFEVVSIIIEEFFTDNANVMLYICDPTDNRQEARARLYRHWYETFEHHDLYTLSDAPSTSSKVQCMQVCCSERITLHTNPFLKLSKPSSIWFLTTGTF